MCSAAYPCDNFALRWMSGSAWPAKVTRSDLEFAKCRLRMFDLVLADQWIDDGVGPLF